jgi:NAD(P)-dependent dehydrogenase (short-subunit alcohol dehydrogenase family)
MPEPKLSAPRPAVLISGAAAGIGRATAERFAHGGWFVGVFDIDARGAAAVAAALAPGSAVAGELDVRDAGSWARTLAAFWDAAGARLDVLVNNAGVLASGAFGEIPLARQQAMVDVNLRGVINGCHAALPYLRQTPGARVVNMASASAIYGQPELATYSATKFAVRGLTEALDLEWRSLGIRVMDLWPLFVQTAMLADVGDAHSLQSLGAHITPQQVARTIWAAVHYRGRIPRVHWLVGRQTHWAAAGARLAPTWLARWLNGRIAGA